MSKDIDVGPEKRVVVYPRFKSMENKGAPVWLVFPNTEAKEKYIRTEYRYCNEEERKHNSAMSTNARRKAKVALQEKRVVCAKHFGFQPRSSASNRWVQRLESPVTPELA